mmetsp:Transcript_18904/g.38825  ORF Transcript_18904/g.38825 Transcript_18904/m.38825 type:complete len:96 (+) Transcript_18904:515-802(+)
MLVLGSPKKSPYKKIPVERSSQMGFEEKGWTKAKSVFLLLRKELCSENRTGETRVVYYHFSGTSISTTTSCFYSQPENQSPLDSLLCPFVTNTEV